MRNVLIILTLLPLFSFSQDKTFTIQEAISGTNLYPETVKQLQWLPGGKHISYLNKEGDQNSVLIFELESKRLGRSFEITLRSINAAMARASQDTFSSFPSYMWVSDSELGFYKGDFFFSYDYQTDQIKKKFEVDSKSYSRKYTTDFDGYVGLIEGGFTYRVGPHYGSRTSPDEGRVIGQAVHRYEFGITEGLFLSDDGSKLAYYDMNESMVTQYPLYALDMVPAGTNMIRYPTAGKTSHQVSVYVRHLKSDKADVRLNTGKVDDHYLTNISWVPDGSGVLVAEVNRDQDRMELNLYSAETGEKIRTLFTEENPRYVEPEHSAVFLPGTDKFIWWSERDQFNHLYLYDLKGNLIKQITKGDWVVTEFHGFDAKAENIFITSTKESPLERHLYCVNIKNGKMKKLTEGEGVHRIDMNEDGTYFIDRFNSPDVPLKTMILDQNGRLFEMLKESENPLEEYKLGEMNIGKLKGKGGDDLFYRVFKPTDFDPKKKYPVVIYLYNGPHVQLVTKSWLGGANLWYQYMAQNGYVVFTIDGRGSDNRGFEFESCIHRQMATLEMEDQMTGVEWLKEQSWVDPDRIGVHGWSYGGYMTINLMTRQKDVFKVAVAGGPVIDWSLYEVMYTERYMDRPDENPDGYQKTNLTNYVGSLNGKLLIIHGAQDDVVLWQHSLNYLKKAIQEGVQLDYFVYPHHPHNVRGVDRIHLYEKVSNYFFDHL